MDIFHGANGALLRSRVERPKGVSLVCSTTTQRVHCLQILPFLRKKLVFFPVPVGFGQSHCCPSRHFPLTRTMDTAAAEQSPTASPYTVDTPRPDFDVRYQTVKGHGARPTEDVDTPANTACAPCKRRVRCESCVCCTSFRAF